MLHLERSKLKSLIDQGLNAAVIGDKLKASAPSITKYAKRIDLYEKLLINGLESRKTPITKEDLTNYLKRNMTAKEIGRFYKCSTATIRNYMRRFKLEHLLISNIAAKRKQLINL